MRGTAMEDLDRSRRMIARGPVPPPVIAAVSARCGHPRHDIIVEAARSGGADLFAEGGRLSPADVAPAKLAPAAVPDLELAFERISSDLGEVRPGQVLMARAVLDGLRMDEISVIEAGTGTGKSLAYLVPAALHAASSGERVAISTHTRNLQEQLLTREIPVMLEAVGLPLKVERLMGRRNYICARRAMGAFARLSGEDPDAAVSLALEAALSPEGTVESLAGPFGRIYPSSVAAPSRCGLAGCADSRRCPLVRARRRALEASLLLVNHALLLTDHRSGGTLIGPCTRVVFDEAHHLESCVMDNLSVRVSSGDMQGIFEEIAPISLSSERWKLFASELRDGGEAARKDVAALGRAVDDAEALLGGIFGKGGITPPDRSPEGRRTRYTDGWKTFENVAGDMKRIYSVNNEIAELLKALSEAPAGSPARHLQSEMRFAGEAVLELSENMRYLEEASDPDGVFWIEWSSSGRPLSICGSPLEVDRTFADYIDERVESAVFTSATLMQDGTFDYFEDRLGIRLCGKEPVEIAAPSPFDYENGMLLLLHTGLEDPASPRFAGSVSEAVRSLVEVTGRNVMVLLTSYRMCREVAEALAAAGGGIDLMVQGGGESRELLASRFRISEKGVLLGVASFWEGVDFPGEELEVLVIPKLPFPVPSEPVFEARSERMRGLGENPFLSLALPEAVLKLRQGMGRLIRRTGDRGVAVLLDPRVHTRSYGERVIAALAGRRKNVATSAEAAEAAAGWLDR